MKTKEIYRITNLINDKCYIGQTNQGAYKRFNQHAKTDSLIGRAIRKYGIENFLIEVLEIVPESEANDAENRYIIENNSVVPNGYNTNEYGRLVGMINESIWYVVPVPRLYKEVRDESLTCLGYMFKIINLANKRFILMKNHQTQIKTWTELWKIIGCKNKITQRNVKKFLTKYNMIYKEGNCFSLNGELFKIIY